MLSQFELTDADRIAVRNMLVEIGRHQENLEETAFLDRAALLAQELPIRIREVFYEFKLRETSPGLLITDNPVSPEDVGPTPTAHWRQGEKRPLNLPQLLHGLYSSLLGEPFGFETQQGGRVFNDLISIPGSRDNASSGAGKVGLHTEDCFQPFMPDYLGFMCLRNEQHAVTTFSFLQNIDIPPSVRCTLSEKYCASTKSNQQAILFGDVERPYLRYGAVDFDPKCDGDKIAAMHFLSDALHRNIQTITLSQGDCLYLDNFVAVHGRAPFEAEYGANGRWFSRLVMVRDLRRTRSFRAAPETRVMLKSRY